MKNKRKGFIPVMLTPFKENGEVDYIRLDELTDFYLEAGSVGLFANCLSSEMFELTPEERLNVSKRVVDRVKGSVPVVAVGNFGNSITEQAEFVSRMHGTGVESVILITSLLAKAEDTDKVFEENLFDLLKLTKGIPVGFYECPVPYKRTLDPQQLRKFVATGRVTYHKDTCCNIQEVREKVAQTREFDFGFYDAHMAHAVESLKAGADGLSCIQGNYFPELIVWLCENYDNVGLSHEVGTVQQFLIDNMEVMHKVYPITAKYYLQKRGLGISLLTRRKVGVFNGNVARGIDEFYNAYESIKSDLLI